MTRTTLAIAVACALAANNVVAQDSTPPPPAPPETIDVRVNVDSGPNPVFDVSVLDEKPEIISGPPLRYPDRLRKAGIEGRVRVQVIIDTRGRAERKSIVILSAPDAGFNDPVREYIRDARFRPGRIKGKAVRTRVIIPIDYHVVRP